MQSISSFATDLTNKGKSLLTCSIPQEVTKIVPNFSEMKHAGSYVFNCPHALKQPIINRKKTTYNATYTDKCYHLVSKTAIRSKLMNTFVISSH